MVCDLYNALAPGPTDVLSCGGISFEGKFPATEHFESDLKAIRKSYEARVSQIDRALGELRETLSTLGAWEDTLLVLTSDHGEAFFEHSRYQHVYIPFDEVLRVPLIVSYPRRLPAAPGPIEDLAWHLDLMPTILDLAEIPAPAGLTGRSLVPLLEGSERASAERAVFPAVLPAVETPENPLRRVVVKGALKHIEGHLRFGDETGLLFDLSRDPGEKQNLRDLRPDDVAALVSLGESYEDELARRSPFVSGRRGEMRGALSEEERLELEALGYLDSQP